LLAELLDCSETAASLQRDVWDFALELSSAQAMQISSSDLRWAVVMGLVEHRLESTSAACTERRFRPVGTPRFTDDSCFVLTPAGAAFFQRLAGDPAAAPLHHPAHALHEPHRPLNKPVALIPVWDAEQRILRVGDEIVKEFKVPADNQELILCTFAELGWPTHIDDPLPPVHGIHPKRRLHDAINCLNRNQRCPRIKFRGDGSGQRIAWTLREAATALPLP
jgi:hypothetical protein